MGVIVVTSTVADGNMHSRYDHKDADVIQNRRTFLQKHGITLDQTTRVKTVYEGNDYCRFREVSSGEKGHGTKDNEVAIADGLVTVDTNHALMLPVADCVGATFYDPIKKVLMLSHLGRHSLEQKDGLKSVQYLIERYGCHPHDILVWLTPAPGKDVYPIWALDNKGMKEVTFEQLHLAGIKQENITDNPVDSDKDPNYYSYSEFLRGNREQDGDHMMVAMMTD